MLGLHPISSVPLSDLGVADDPSILNVFPGTLTLTGQSVTLTYSGDHFTLDVSPEALTLTGQSANLDYDLFPHFVSVWGPFGNGPGVFTPGSMPSHQADDILIFFTETNDEAVTVSGWTEAGDSPASNSGTNPTRLTVFWKRAASGSEAAPSTNSLADHCVGTILVYRNCADTGDPFDVTASDSGGTGTSISAIGATSTTDYCRILSAVATTRDVVTGVSPFSSFTNSSIRPVIIRANAADTSGTGGGIGVADGYKPSAGTYGTTAVVQSHAVEYTTWTGALKPLIVGAFTLDASPSTLTLTGQEVDLAYSDDDKVLDVDPGELTLTGQEVDLILGHNLNVSPGVLTLTPQLVDLDAQIDFVFTLNFLVDLLPPELSGDDRTYSETLTVDGSPIPVRSWSLEETDQSLTSQLSIELARNSDRSAITRDADIDFALSVNGTGETLLNNGYLRRKDYSVSRQGIGPDDRVTFTALPEMAARLNTVPETNTVFFDPARHNVTASDFEGVYDKELNYTPPVVTSVTNLDLYEIFERVFVTACGFTEYVTNIPNFPIAIVEFAAGQSYMNGLSGIIGMFEPELIPYTGPGIEIRDGTSGQPGGSPAPREVTISEATNLGVASDIAIVDALLIHVAQERFTYDYYTDRLEQTTATEGTAGTFSTTYYDITINTTYRDYFRTEHPDRPIKTEIVRVVRTTDAGVTTVHRSTENFTFDGLGRMSRRTKTVEAYVPSPFSFVLGLNEISTEVENVTYAMHPYTPRQYYVKEREINLEGWVWVDSENQQLGEDYSRSIMDTYRAGNAIDTMTTDYRKIHTFKEAITPQRNNFLRIRRTEIDWLANQKHEDRDELRQGEIGVNIFVQEQHRIYILPEGEAAIEGTIESVNMGELPLDTAIVLGERILNNRRELANRVSFNIIGIDNTLQKGTPITAKGRNGENLGVYVIEARTLSYSGRTEDGPGQYSMTIQARQA